MSATIKPWIPATHADYDTLVGKEVYTRDGERVGTIKEVYHPDDERPRVGAGHSFLMDVRKRRNWFDDLEEVYLPETAIAGVGDDRVLLAFTADQLRGQGWVNDIAGADPALHD